MNKLIRTLIALASLGLVAGTARAEAAFKPLVVDMTKLLENHYKTEEAYAKFNAFGQKVQEQLDAASKQIQEMAAQYQELVDQSKNTVLKPEARAAAEADAQKKGEEIQKMQNDAQNFRIKSQNQIQQRIKTHRDGLNEEIILIVKNIAKAKGATIVFDKSVSPVTGVPGVIFSDDSYDITDEALKEENKDRPPAPPVAATAAAAPVPAAPKPAAGATPAPTPAPAKP
jgi:Skp family chaperone for outer membrane proteins